MSNSLKLKNMARKLKIYIAASLNGRIATPDGSVAWLDSIPHPKDEDYGYYKFYATIDTTIMGYATYAQVTGWDLPFPYPDKKNYVLTRKTELSPDPNVEFVTKDHIDFINILKKDDGKDIWLIGGGQVNTVCLNAGLVDELIIHQMPIILNGGIEVFENLPIQRSLELVSSKKYESGVMELHYAVKNNS